jgi:hypothetical protein
MPSLPRPRGYRQFGGRAPQASSKHEFAARDMRPKGQFAPHQFRTADDRMGHEATMPEVPLCQLPPAADMPLDQASSAQCQEETYAVQQEPLLDDLVGASEQRLPVRLARALWQS